MKEKSKKGEKDEEVNGQGGKRGAPVAVSANTYRTTNNMMQSKLTRLPTLHSPTDLGPSCQENERASIPHQLPQIYHKQ